MADQANFPDIYIDGSSAGDGSLASPYSDFGDINWDGGGDNDVSVAVAANEDVVIHLLEGIEWQEQLTIGTSGSAAHPITITSYGSDVAPIVSGMRDVVGWSTGGNWVEPGEQEDNGLGVTMDTDSTFDPYNFRMWIAAATMSIDGDEVRVELTAHSTDETTIATVFIGEKAASGDDWDMEPGTIKELLFSAGSGCVMAGGTTLYSDWETYNFDKTKDYIISIGQTNNYRKDNVWVADHGFYKQNGEAEAGDANVTGFSVNATSYLLSELGVKSGGGTGTYVLSLANNPRRLVIDETEYIQAESAEDIDSTYRWFYDPGGTELHLYATENPATDYSSMYYAANVHGIFIDGESYITIQDLEVQGGVYGITIYEESSNILIHDCTVAKYTAIQGIRIIGETDDDYTQVEDVEIYDCTIDADFHNSAADWQNAFPADGILVGDSVINCKIHDNFIADWVHSCIHIAGITANCETQYIEVYDNTLDAANTNYCRGLSMVGLADGQVAFCKAYRNLIQNTTVRNQILGDHNEFYYNIIHTVTEAPYKGATNVSDGIGLFASAANKKCHDNKIYNNVIYNTADHGIFVYGNTGYGDVVDNLLRNNIVMNWGAGMYGIHVEDDATVLNNTYQNNLLYKSGESDVVSYRGTLRTIAEFNGEDGGDGDVIQNNIGGDPLMTDPAGDDFTLQLTSPCINTGIDVSLTTDYAGAIVTAPPNIGAYETVLPGGGGLSMSMGMKL
jgi:hypothetical protein